MRGFAFSMLAAVVGIGLTVSAPKAQAQVGVGVEVGPAPACPYGYYDAAPYNCAPYGYYGPEWFNDGIFIGAGPWFRGPEGFYGHVDTHFHPEHGYRGPYPAKGEHASHDVRHMEKFHGDEMRDGRGHRK